MGTFGIIGRGMIGGEMQRRLNDSGHQVSFVYHTESKEPYLETLHQTKPDGVYLAIASPDKGVAARDFILETVRAGIPIVTCEKGSFSYFADELDPYRHLIGYRASAGGGTGILTYTGSRSVNGQAVEIEAVLNGTLNFIFYNLQQGSTIAEACRKAKKLGFAEPGESNPVTLIQGEISDLVMKTLVFYNILLAKGKKSTPDQLENGFTLSSNDLRHLNMSETPHRFVVSFSNVSMPEHAYFRGKSIQAQMPDGWYISLGLRVLSKTDNWLPQEEWNAVQLVEGALGDDGRYILYGPGAGPAPTTKAMQDDMNALLGKH